MPPKKEEGPHPTIVKAAKNSIAGVNNALFARSIQGLKKTSTKNAIVKAYRNTLKKNANEKAAVVAVEEAKTGGINLRNIFDNYVAQWNAIPYVIARDSKTRQSYTKLSPTHEDLLKGINDILVGAQGLTVSRIETNTPYYYAERAIARDIMRGDYDDKLEQMKYVVEKEGPGFIAGDHGKNLLGMIANRKHYISPGGGAGTAGGARRRRRTHKRKTHKRRH
jgi:hypothetical protein